MSRPSRLISHVSLLASLVFFGAGCSATQKLQTIKLPTKDSVIAQIQGIPEHWSQVGVMMGTSTVRVAFPGFISPIEGSNSNQVIQVDMGTAVLDPGDRAVPTRSLRVFTLRAEDKRIKDCAFSETGWQSGKIQNVQKNLSYGTFPSKFCRTSEADAAMGNRYAIHSFATRVGDQYLVMEFLVHSVACENYEKPAEQCVAYDEKRDTALFAEVLGQLKVE